MTAAPLNSVRALADQWSGAAVDVQSARPLAQYVEWIKFASAGTATLAIPAGADFVVLTAVTANGYCKGYTGSAPTYPVATTSDGSGFEAVPAGQSKAFRLDQFVVKTALAGIQLQMDAAGTMTAAFYTAAKVS